MVDTPSKTTLTYRQDNFFQLSEPEFCECTMWRYASTHSLMYIQVLRLGNIQPGQARNLFLRFTGIHYVEGPVKWQGANFKLASIEESKDLWRKLAPNEAQAEMLDFIARETYLLVVDTAQFRIKLLAETADVDTAPPPFPAEHWMIN
jgi:hypothetical protein